jgi:hypothetical protein
MLVIDYKSICPRLNPKPFSKDFLHNKRKKLRCGSGMIRETKQTGVSCTQLMDWVWFVKAERSIILIRLRPMSIQP